MPFVLRTSTLPPLNKILELEQIVIVDQTGPTVSFGVQTGKAALVAEFLKGPFVPTQVNSSGEIASTFGGVSDLLSQNSPNFGTAVQDGSGGFHDGNGLLQLKGKQFNKLVLVRVDTEARTTGPDGPNKGTLSVTVLFAAADLTLGFTNKTIIVPAGTRFADAATVATAGEVVATSEDITIPTGTAAPSVVITPKCFYVKVAEPIADPASPIASLAFVIDTLIPGFASTVSAVTNATALTPPGIGTTLRDRIASAYTGTPFNPSAIDKTMPGSDITDDINVIWAARNTSVIRSALWQNAQDAAQTGRGRIASTSANPAVGPSAADASAAKIAALALVPFTGEAADRAIVNFPYFKMFSSELGRLVTISPDGLKASLLSVLPDEYLSSVENTIIQFIDSLEDAFVTQPLTRADYVQFKSEGLSSLKRDRAVGWQFQSGITAVNPTTFPTRVADNRRRLADFIQDTIASLAAPYQQKPGTTERVDALVSEIDNFLSGLVSANNPSQQRIESYLVDAESANTPQLIAVGVRQIIVKVRMLGDLLDLVFLTQIGPTVEIP